MRRGDVVRTLDEFYALPVGSVVSNADGVTIERAAEGRHEMPWEPFPALVRVVGPVEPEWLEAAAIAVDAELRGGKTMGELARAAVAAADKARGIVNSREEFDALPAGARVVDVVGNAYDSGSPYAPDEWPCVVVPKRIYT